MHMFSNFEALFIAVVEDSDPPSLGAWKNMVSTNKLMAQDIKKIQIDPH